MTVSVVIPAKNEVQSLGAVLDGLLAVLPEAEIIVVDDGSTDGTADLVHAKGCICLSHRESLGNGASIKAGVRHASGDVIVCMDADGQHDPSDVPKLLAEVQAGMDMSVGARSAASHAGWWRRIANLVYARLASVIVGHRIHDLTSGFRAVRAKRFREFLYLLPNGFSYPTTITMAFFRAGYQVSYVEVKVRRRDKGSKSHIRLLHDGARFFTIIFKMATLYSPIKVFLPIALFFFSSGVLYYLYTFAVAGRFTNFGALLLTTSVITFLIGLVSEQISSLLYRGG